MVDLVTRQGPGTAISDTHKHTARGLTASGSLDRCRNCDCEPWPVRGRALRLQTLTNTQPVASRPAAHRTDAATAIVSRDPSGAGHCDFERSQTHSPWPHGQRLTGPMPQLRLW